MLIFRGLVQNLAAQALFVSCEGIYHLNGGKVRDFAAGEIAPLQESEIFFLDLAQVLGPKKMLQK